MEAIALCGTRMFLQAVTEAHVGTAEPAPGGLTLRVLALHTAAQLKAPSSCLHILQWRQRAMQEPNGATCSCYPEAPPHLSQFHHPEVSHSLCLFPCTNV